MTVTTPERKTGKDTGQGKDPHWVHWWLYSEKMGLYTSLCRTRTKTHAQDRVPPPEMPRCVVCKEIMDSNKWIYIYKEINE